jgi:uncharacterized protein (UPF0218 family)
MLILPEGSRGAFKKPFGTLFGTMDEIVPLLEGKVVYAVGDVVSYNLRKKNIPAALSVIDGFTMRSPCRHMPALTGHVIRVKNPAGTITDELIAALGEGIAHPPAIIVVDGEEDLATIPLVIAAPEGAAVIYGQPHEGVVLNFVTSESKATARRMLGHFVRNGQ